jgi:hypothetical protein
MMFQRVCKLGLALSVPCVFALGAVSAAAQSAQAPAAKTADAAALPAPQSILDRHIAAIGGREAMKKHSSVHVTGTISVPANGISGTVETFAARPNKQLEKMTLAGVGDILRGFDGTHAWSNDPMRGPSLATGKELEERMIDADFDANLNASTRYSSMKTLEKTTFDGRECYKLSLTRKDGVEDIEFYDVATGLKAGSINTRESGMGKITATSTLREYKKFGDILQPTAVTQSAMGAEFNLTITSIEYDKVDPAVFGVPAAIKALVK